MTERLLAGQMHALRLLAEGQPLETILHALCLALEEVMPDAACSVLCLDPVHRTLHHGAGPSLPPAYFALTDGVRIGPAVGSCGSAACHGRTIISGDIEIDPLWADWRDVALKFGLRACWSVPMIARESGRILGTFAVYYREPRAPTADDLALVEMCVDLAGVAMAQTEARAALAASEDRFRAAFEEAAIGMTIVHPDGAVLRVNRRSCQILGYSEEDLLRTTLLAITHADDLAANADLMRRALAGEFDAFEMEKRYLSPRGGSGTPRFGEQVSGTDRASARRGLSSRRRRCPGSAVRESGP